MAGKARGASFKAESRIKMLAKLKGAVYKAESSIDVQDRGKFKKLIKHRQIGQGRGAVFKVGSSIKSSIDMLTKAGRQIYS